VSCRSSGNCIFSLRVSVGAGSPMTPGGLRDERAVKVSNGQA